jgi:hypothetical protein
MSRFADRLSRLRRLYPKRRDDGLMYGAKKDFEGRTFQRITVHAILRSSEETVMLAPIKVEREHGKTADEWGRWCERHVLEVFGDGVLPGINLRTGKSWYVEKWLGFILSYAVRKSRTTATRGARSRAVKTRR